MIAAIPSLATAGGLCAGAGLFSWAAVAPCSQLFGPTVRHTNDPGTIALTFDDGPNPDITTPILGLLDKYQASATFFQLGKYIRQFPELSNEILRRGHTLGNHTDSHPRLVFCSPENIAREIQDCAAAIQFATSRSTPWMRPPYGFRGPQLQHALQTHNLKVRVVMWSRSGRDWRLQSPERLINRLQQVKGGDIVLLHDGDHRVVQGNRSHTVRALEHWLPRWKDMGLRFINLDQLATTNN